MELVKFLKLEKVAVESCGGRCCFGRVHYACFHCTSRARRFNVRDDALSFRSQSTRLGVPTTFQVNARVSQPPRSQTTSALHCWRFCLAATHRSDTAYLQRDVRLVKASTDSRKSLNMTNDGKSSSVWSVEEDVELARLQVRRVWK